MAKESSTEASRTAVRAFLKGKGLGGTFTLIELRLVVPDAAQADRRMRELRQAIPPWKIHSSQSDRSLPSGTYRIDVIGGDKIAPQVSARVRREVFEAAGNRCQVCGIGVGEEYAEWPGETARLQLGHYQPLDQGGSPTTKSNMRAECHRCNGGIRDKQGTVITTASVRARIKSLPRAAQDRLLQWMEQRHREISDEERLYYETGQLPPEGRDEVLDELRQMVKGGPAS